VLKNGRIEEFGSEFGNPAPLKTLTMREFGLSRKTSTVARHTESRSRWSPRRREKPLGRFAFIYFWEVCTWSLVASQSVASPLAEETLGARQHPPPL